MPSKSYLKRKPTEMLKYLALPIVYLLIFASCGTKNSEGIIITNSVSSKKFVQGHTTGLISVHDEVQIIFNDIDELNQSSDASIISVSPLTDVEMEWVNGNQLRLSPKNDWKPDVTYKIQVHLDQLFHDAPKGDPFAFSFQSIGPRIHVSEGELEAGSKKNEMNYRGSISYTGFGEKEEPHPKIQAALDGKKLSVDLKNDESGKLNYHVGPIKRIGKNQTLNITYEDVSYSAVIPSKNALAILKMKSNDDDPNVIEVHFSNQLASQQELKGLIEVSDQERVRTVISGNILKLFPRTNGNSERTVRVFPGVTDIHGLQTKTIYSESVRMGPSIPDIKMSSTNQSMAPDPNKCLVSFKSIHLKSIIVRVEEVKERNMLQHLQVNHLNAKYQINRVAEPILMKRVRLSDLASVDLSQWNSFDLDLSKYFEQDPGSMYRIILGFDPDDVSIACDEITNRKVTPSYQNEEEYLSALYDQPTDWSTYDWRERNNPCHITFYQKEKWKSKNVISTPMAIIAKKNSKNDLTCFISNIISAKPEVGVNVVVYNYQQRKLLEGKTDSEGRVRFQFEKDQPYFIVSEKSGSKSYLTIQEGESLSMSPFNISGEEFQGDGKGFIYAERGVWRPGDSVFLNFIWDGNRLDGMPIICQVKDPKGSITHRIVNDEPVGNIYAFPFATKDDAPTGNWRVEVRVGASVFTKKLKIETVKPNRMAIKVSTREEDVTHENLKQPIQFDVQWLTGVNAGNVKIEADYFLKEKPLKVADYPEFSFSPAYGKWKKDREKLTRATSDGNGHLVASLDVTDAKKANGPAQCIVTGKAFEPSGDFSIFQKKIDVFPYSHFVGIKKPVGQRSLKFDENHEFQFITADKDGVTAAGHKIKITIRRLDWRWWWDRSSRRSSYSVDTDARVILQTQITSAKKPVKWQMESGKLFRGRFLIEAEDLDSGHKSSEVFYVHESDYWWMNSDMPSGASILDFDLENSEVELGDKIEIEIPSEEGSSVLLSIEANGNVIQSTWAETKKGITILKMEAVPEMLPNAYVHVALIHPYQKSVDGRPIRSYAVKPISIIDRNTVITPEIKCPKEVKPQEEFTVTVSEKQGRPMTYTLAVVDEGLLSLTNFETPDPHTAMMSKQALSILTWDNYGQIIGAENGNRNRVLAIGGDMELQGSEERDAKRFEPVVKHLGPFELKKSGKQSHKIILPAYLGNVRIMAVAAKNGAFGSSDENMLVREDLMVLGTTPRLVASQDDFSLPVTTFVMNDKIKSANVTIEVQGPLEIIGSASQNFQFNDQTDVTQSFKVRAKNAVGTGRIKIRASSGSHTTEHEINLPIISKSPVVREVADYLLSPNGNLSIDYKPIGLNQTNSATIEVSNFPSMNLQQRLDYLIRYPYGCGEQTTSAMFGQVCLDQLAELSTAEQDAIKRNLQGGFSRIQSLQSISGGIRYWPGTNEVNLWLSNYVGHLLVVSNKNGYSVPSVLQKNLMSFLTKRANGWTESVQSDDEVSQAYRLYVLALNETPALGAMNRMKSSKVKYDLARLLLSGSYALAGHDKTAKKMLEDVQNFEYRDYRRYYGREMRNQSIFALIYQSLGNSEESLSVVMKIANALGSRKYLNTHDIAWGLLAVSSFVEKNEVGESVDVAIQSNIGNARLQGSAPIHQWSPEKFDQATFVQLSNKSSNSSFVRLLSSGQPGREKQIAAAAKNINLKVNYTDMKGNAIRVGELKQGTSFIVRMDVNLKAGLYSNVEDVALQHVFPSGWEMINTRLDGTEEFIKQSNYDYMDIRDDRIIFHTNISRGTRTYYCVMNATYAGEFYYPSVQAESMYQDDVYARTSSSIVKVISAK